MDQSFAETGTTQNQEFTLDSLSALRRRRPTEIYETLFLEEYQGVTSDEMLRTSLEIARAIDGTEINFPKLDLPCHPGLYASLNFGRYDGLLDLTLRVDTPNEYQNDMFAQVPRTGKSMKELVGSSVPLWKLRFTPTSPSGGLIAATQRFIGSDDYSITSYRNWMEKELGDSWRSMSREDLYRKYHRKHNDVVDGLHLPYELGNSTMYLFKGIPGNRIIGQLENKYAMDASMLLSLCGIAAIQRLGFTDLRLVSEKAQYSLSKHRGDEEVINSTTDYDELGGKYFSPDPRYDGDPFPWHLVHTGTQLGVNQGQSGMSPKFIEYMTSAPLELKK